MARKRKSSTKSSYVAWGQAIVVGGVTLFAVGLGLFHSGLVKPSSLPSAIADTKLVSYMAKLAGVSNLPYGKDSRGGAIEADSHEVSILDQVEAMVTGKDAATIEKEKKAKKASSDQETKLKSSSDKETSSSGKSYSHTVNAKAKMAIVLDDFGYNEGIIGQFNDLPIPLTYAVIPYHDYSQEAANSGYEAGKDIMIHLPMESQGHQNAENTTISASMSDARIRQIVDNAVNAVPHAIGFNNHQGSAATSNSHVMNVTLSQAKKHGLFYLDSRTAASSVGAPTARSMGIPTGINEHFLDNVNTTEAVEGELAKAVKMALDAPGGYVIVIGHARPHTLEALKNMIPSMQEQGIEFVFVKEVLR